MMFTKLQVKQVNSMFEELQEIVLEDLEMELEEFKQLFEKNVASASGALVGGQIEILAQFIKSAKCKRSPISGGDAAMKYYNGSMFYNELNDIAHLCEWAQQSRLLAWRFDVESLTHFMRHYQLIQELHEVYLSPD